jgi:hypothetical protein
MALPAHQRPFLHLLVAAFAIGMKGFHQGRFTAGSRQLVAVRTALVFGGFIFSQVAGFIVDVMAHRTRLDPGRLVVFIVAENSRRAACFYEGIIADKLHVFLAMGGNQKNQTSH